MTRTTREADGLAGFGVRKDAQLALGTFLADGLRMPHSSRPTLRTVVYWLTVASVFIAVTGVVRPTRAQSQSFGLEWPGNGAVRRMLYWSSPPPIYPMTYIFRVFPRKKIVPQNSPTGYYTTFFWGNNGNFVWSGGSANTYYGMHPYPSLGGGPPNGVGSWEISVDSRDITTGTEVQWDRWFTQAIRVRRVSSTVTEHEFYYDWSTASPPGSCTAANKCISYSTNSSSWAATNPPFPSIVVGQAPDLCGPPPCSTGQSWGGYPGWEEFNGIIRGMQFYTSFLSLADIAAEINSPKSSAAGLASIWYLNLDPRPSDVTDKKGVGTPHNPAWGGTTALQWSSGTSPSPNPPSSLSVQ